MSLITKKRISTGITWVAIEEADLFICCGCPADAVKHLKKAGVINPYTVDGFECENGPNALLLSDTLIQNGQVANLTEFLVLQMLYLQGMNLPHHPNYRKNKPILIGYKKQIDMQIDYVSIGNHGLSTKEEIMEAGVTKADAEKIFETKLYYAGGEITPMANLIAPRVLEDRKIEIKNGVFIHRVGVNRFRISYKQEHVEVDMNLKENEHFISPYDLPFREIERGKFSITHTGEGNGWDERRPCMASVIHYDGSFFLIDAGPNVMNNLACLGIGLSEIDGIFLSHIHDDHFAGITELLNAEKKLNFYATKLVRKTAEKKLKALMDSDLDLIQLAFHCIDLEFDVWKSIKGLEVKPMYSPHTVETSIFNFRVRENGTYKTYSHLSDTINFKEFRKIVDQAPHIFSNNDFSSVENRYLTQVNLKKIDVGGGAIHGHLSDYSNDSSDLLVMAHGSAKIQSDKPKFVNVDFGDTHILVSDEKQNFLVKRSIEFLRPYFDHLEDKEILPLADQKLRRYRPGEIILQAEEDTNKIMLIINGLVYHANGTKTIQMLDAGNFIGYSKRYFRYEQPQKYVAWSYVHGLEYDESFMNKVIEKWSLTEDIDQRINLIRILRQSNLIHEVASNSVFNHLSKSAKIIRRSSCKFTEKEVMDYIFIITGGSVTIEFNDRCQMQIGKKEHFGGLGLLRDHRRNQQFSVSKAMEAISIPIEKLTIVPKLIWRLIELEEARYQLSFFKDK